MIPVSPVIVGLEPYEQVYGGPDNGQPEYLSLPALRSPEGRVMSRWELTDDERKMIANGADIFLTIHCQSYPPTQVRVGNKAEDAEFTKENMRLDDSLAVRMLAQDVETATRKFNEKCAEVYNHGAQGQAKA